MDKTKQIKQLERDIKVLQDIIEGREPNYTSHTIPVLKEGLIKFQSDLSKLQERIGK